MALQQEERQSVQQTCKVKNDFSNEAQEMCLVILGYAEGLDLLAQQLDTSAQQSDRLRTDDCLCTLQEILEPQVTSLADGCAGMLHSIRPFILCADAGQNVARRLGLIPDAYIGDFDSSPQPDGHIITLSPDKVSIPPADAEHIMTVMAQKRTAVKHTAVSAEQAQVDPHQTYSPQTSAAQTASDQETPAQDTFPQERIVFQLPPEKDMTDSEAALDLAVQLGFSHIAILGGLGKRLDHTLGNLALLAKYTDYSDCAGKRCSDFSTADTDADSRGSAEKNSNANDTAIQHTDHTSFATPRSVHVRMFDGYNSVTMIVPGSYSLSRGSYTYLGVIPYGGSAIGVTLEGVKYPVHKLDFKDTSTLGVSNEIVSENAQISLTSGRLLLIQSRDA